MELKDLKNVGKATLKDLEILNINSVEELSECDPTDLFHQLELRTQKYHDPCMWDVFAAIIHQAKTGEAKVWWQWTAERKKLQEKGLFFHVVDRS